MQKTLAINMEHKSNLNTSCASDLHSSVLSSVFQLNLDDSLAKANQLRGMYFGACQEEDALARENKELTGMLDKLKAQLEELIDRKFGVPRHQKSQVNNAKAMDEKAQRMYKPGSITKINRKKQEISSTNIGDPARRVCKREPTFHRDEQQIQFSDVKYLQNATKRDSLVSKQLTQDLEDKNWKLEPTKIAKPKINQHRYRRSMDILICRDSQDKQGVLTRRQEHDRKGQVEMGSRKSYLNSPRASVLASPRSTFIR